jgi:ABC-type Mn2+/Zn2+ transport system permease subunit
LIVSMQILGVTLIAAALVTPPITARLLTDSFNRMIFLSSGVGAFAGLTGMFLSFHIDVASGATIVLTQVALFLIVLTVMSLRRQAQKRMIHVHV